MGLGQCRPALVPGVSEQVLETSGPSRGTAARKEAQSLTSDEVAKRIQQLNQELRMLRDDNFQIREEQLRLESQLRDQARRRQQRKVGGGGAAAGPPAAVPEASRRQPMRAAAPATPPAESPSPIKAQATTTGAGSVDKAQQLAYMQQLVNRLEVENARIKTESPGGGGGGGDLERLPRDDSDATGIRSGGVVTEDEYRQLQERLKALQQSHLEELQAARQLQSAQASAAASTAASRSSTPGPGARNRSSSAGYHDLRVTETVLRGRWDMEQPSFRGSAVNSVPPSGLVTPVSTSFQCAEETKALQDVYHQVVAEQEALRAKVRKLAHTL